MVRVNNYLIQASQAKERFLTYDQQKLIEKFQLKWDDNYLYLGLLWRQYRIHRSNGNMDILVDGDLFKVTLSFPLV